MKKNLKVSLRIKLTLAFLLVTLTLFAVVSVLANQILEKQFKTYVINQQEQKNQDIVALVSKSYEEWGNKWNVQGIENLGVSALGEGLMLRINEANGLTLWDANVHNSGMCAMMLENMAASMQANDMHINGGYVEKSYPLVNAGVNVGSVDVGYYGPYYFTDNDVRFLNTLNRLLFWAAGIATLISVIMGFMMAKRLSTPIQKIMNTAGQIAKGNYHDRVEAASTTKEINELAITVNSLATTLENQELLRKRLTADVAHELRTPLATLQSHLEAMIDGVWKADSERLTSCHEETVRITKLVGNLENLAKYENEESVLEFRQVSVKELIQRVVLTFEPLLSQKKLTLKVEVDSENMTVSADEDMLSQVLINLLSNSVKYTPEGGQLTVAAVTKETEVILSVRDTGIGISQENLPYIFERFFRADASRNRQTGGAGIGLAIVKSLVAAHKGTVEVTSELGAGSQFSVHLPK